jgi:hypothetical protein
MIYNKDYLFIHIPRSAGKCIKSAIIPFLEKPIYFAQKCINENFFNHNDYIRINEFLVHSSLEEIEFLKSIKNAKEIKNERLSRMFIENQNLPDLKEIKNIVMCLRNPLDRAKSLYKFYYIKHKYLDSFQSFTRKLADNNFSVGKGKHRFLRNTKNFFIINGEIPKNVKFIRFDYLEEDLCKLFNVNKIDVQSKKHNEVYQLKEAEKAKLFKVKDINEVISNINKWEEWSIQRGLLNPITEKDFL